MFGTNPIRKPTFHDGQSLEVQEIFATKQGEGPFTGTPAIFVRLGGCNLACHFCDTEFESYKTQTLTEILRDIAAAQTHPDYPNASLIVLTGGEPLRQPIGPLCAMLLAQNFTVQIETNGTLFQPLDPRIKIICSPKNTGIGYARIRGDLLSRLDAIKFIISAQNPHYSSIAEIGQKDYDIPVYLQPMDEIDPTKNAENLALTQELCQKTGYHLSQQMHKIWGIP